jgi:polar amino acid transport system substrate-binding protein
LYNYKNSFYIRGFFMKTKKILTLLLIFTFAITIFSGCSSSSSKKQTALERVKAAGKLVVGVDDTYPPMEYRDESNKLIGFDKDMTDAIGKKLGVTVEYVPTDFNGILVALESGKFDTVVSALSITDERKKEIDFSKPYIQGGQIVIVKTTNTKITTPADLKGKIVGVQLGTTGEDAAAKINGIKEIKKYDKITEAFHDLTIGRTEAMVADMQVGEYYIAKEPGQYKVLTQKLTSEPLGIGFKKGDVELETAVQKAIDELLADGTLSKLSTTWFGHDIYKK